MKRGLIFLIILFLGIFLWSKWVIDTHPRHSIVSWDEGFHGGTALFVSESLRDHFNFPRYKYILDDFINGMVWYMPLWWGTAGILGAILGPSVDIYRFGTLLFGILSIVLVSLFVRSQANEEGGLITGITLALSPIFIIYSHLMMIEVPLLFSVTLALVAYYLFLTQENLLLRDYILIILAFVIGVTTKITAIALIFGVILSFGPIIFFFYKQTAIYKSYFSKLTAIFLLASFLTFCLYRLLTRTFLNADMLTFYLDQAKGLTGDKSNIILVMTKILLGNITFYTRDFSHMIPLTLFWIGSSIGYVALKRSLLAYYLLTWSIVTYLIFGAVKPQSVQYILPIFAPIAIGTGLFWGELINRFRAFFIFPAVSLLIIFLGLAYFNKSETIGWRLTMTNQDRAAQFVSENALYGERIISNGDGTRFLIRLAGVNNLQTINGVASHCNDSFQDSADWAVSDLGPQNPVKLAEVRKPNWIKQLSFPSSTQEETVVFRNTNNTSKVIINDPSKPCPRLLRLGRNEFNIQVSNAKAESITINLQYAPLKVIKSIEIKPDNFSKEGTINFTYENQAINRPVYLLVLPRNKTSAVESVEISSK